MNRDIDIKTAINQAVMVERERCARIAERGYNLMHPEPKRWRVIIGSTCNNIADAIRDAENVD